MADPLFDEWRAYQKLLVHDYMNHQSFFNRLQQELRQRYRAPLAILDLGCGDVSPILQLLETLAVSEYSGVDQSETALAMAAVNLESLDIPTRLYNGDLLDTLRTLTGCFDVIVASFSFHHLETAALKTEVLRECCRVLAPAGMIAIIDVFHSEGETREDYLRRWVDFARKNYLTLEPAEMNSLVDHVLSNDFPEALSVYRSIGRAAGLNRFEDLLGDRENLNHLVTLAQ